MQKTQILLATASILVIFSVTVVIYDIFGEKSFFIKQPQEATTTISEIERLKDKIAELEAEQVEERNTNSTKLPVEEAVVNKTPVQDSPQTQEPASVTTETKDIDTKGFTITHSQPVAKMNEQGLGFYAVYFYITPEDEDILIPYSTNDTSQGVTGITYTIEGDDFSGYQSSEISCSRKSNFMGIDNCKFLAGKTNEMLVRVWLSPSEAGNYSIRFADIKYIKKSSYEYKELVLDNVKTGVVYLY